jgi:GDP-L-fucose synthase
MRVLVTGGHGFLGGHVCDELRRRGHHVFAPRSHEFDLREPSQARGAVYESHAEAVVHLAARVGGIGANVEHPGSFFYDNAVMGIHLMEEARLAGVAKFLTVGTGCAYPERGPMPQSEDALWDGYPAQETAPYAMAKKMLLVQSQAYRSEYGFNAVYLIPTNLYGPRDSFDPEHGHAVPSIIRKVVEAVQQRSSTVELWGTGLATRDFLYVEDAARGIVKALDRYDGRQPMNLGSGVETPIVELAGAIAGVCGYGGAFEWSTDRPDGQPRRWLDTRYAESQIGFKPKVALEDGLRRTVEWWAES